MAARIRRGEAGFTLSEILISLGLVGVLAAALLAAAQVQVQLHREQSRVQSAQDNTRAALDILAGAARLIGAPSRGYGFVNSTGSGPAAVPIFRVFDNFNNLGPDRLDVVVPAGVYLATSTDTAATAQSLEVMRFDPASQDNPGAAPAATAGFEAGDYVILANVFSAAPPRPPSILSAASACAGAGQIGASLLQVLSVASSTRLTVQPVNTGACSFPRGSLAVRASATGYYVDGSQQLVAEEGGAARPNPLPLGAASPVAEHIADLQIAVGVDGLNGLPADGVLTENGAGANDDEWAFNVPGELLPAQPPSALRITIVGRSATADLAVSTGAGRPRIEDHEAGAADGFRYRVLTTTVVPRNLVLP